MVSTARTATKHRSFNHISSPGAHVYVTQPNTDKLQKTQNIGSKSFTGLQPFFIHSEQFKIYSQTTLLVQQNILITLMKRYCKQYSWCDKTTLWQIQYHSTAANVSKLPQ